MTEQFNKQPKCINDMGEEVFLKVPFYRRKNKTDVVYINPDLYEKVFNKKYDYEQAKKDILDRFSVTLDGNEDVIGYGYIDRQEDPTDIALNGNKGSGRAFYLYENCNIKGEKTPFATSPRDDYNNGKYSLDCAIQECLMSNVLRDSMEPKTFGTLAILDTHEKYLFPHTKEAFPCSYIIRYYDSNELYRFSHRFVNKKELKKEELEKIATTMGALEGNKFIKRFLHGAWSIGNISIEGNMIDLDTSFYVLARHPQWCYTDKYITNYFGFEHYGQLKVLETILNSKLNCDNVSYDYIESIILSKREETIKKNFPILLGYSEEEYKEYKNKFDDLCDEFMYLSQVIYDNYDNLNSVDRNCKRTNIFDFSNLFRFYEISKQKGIWNISHGLYLLINKYAMPLEYISHDDQYHEKILSFFKNIIITDESKYLEIMSKALSFLSKFDELDNEIQNNKNIDKNKKLIKSYLENQDKTYLAARKWMRSELVDFYHEKGPKLTNDVMNILINFCKDYDYNNEEFLCDLKLFEEGILYRIININGKNRFCFKFFDDSKLPNIVFNINDKEYVMQKDSTTNNYYSDYIYNYDIEFASNVSLKDFNLNSLGRDEEVKQNKANKK